MECIRLVKTRCITDIQNSLYKDKVKTFFYKGHLFYKVIKYNPYIAKVEAARTSCE